MPQHRSGTVPPPFTFILGAAGRHRVRTARRCSSNSSISLVVWGSMHVHSPFVQDMKVRHLRGRGGGGSKGMRGWGGGRGLSFHYDQHTSLGDSPLRSVSSSPRVCFQGIGMPSPFYLLFLSNLSLSSIKSWSPGRLSLSLISFIGHFLLS